MVKHFFGEQVIINNLVEQEYWSLLWRLRKHYHQRKCRFKMSSGNIDYGTIKLYGVKVTNMALISNGTTIFDGRRNIVKFSSMVLIKKLRLA